MNSYETVNDVLVKLFNEIMDVEERALLTSEYKDISVNDMHVIEAIGIREPKNMSTVARAVSVTVGTLTIAINHLVKKGYVERSRSEEDRRVVLVSLSEKGEKAYFHHRMFHEKMGSRNIVRPGARMVMIVVMKFTEPRMVLRPSR